MATSKLITRDDVIRGGLCADGVYKQTETLLVTAIDALTVARMFPEHSKDILYAACLDGDGDRGYGGGGYGGGDGDGGYGGGDGDGYGCFDGDGDGYGGYGCFDGGGYDGYGDGRSGSA